MVYFRPHHPQQRPGWPEYLAQQANSAQDTRLKRFYENTHFSAQAPISKTPLVAVDIETTGLDPQRHGIVSLGLVPFDMQRIYLSQHRYWVLKPRETLESKSVTLHGITHQQIADAPDLLSVLDDLLAGLAGRLVVVHYGHMERHFLNHAIQVRLGESFLFPMIDTMALEARFHRLSLSARVRRWLGRQPTSIRLYDSRKRYGLPLYQGHHALSDALATAELFQAQIGRHFSPDTPLHQLWL